MHTYLPKAPFFTKTFEDADSKSLTHGKRSKRNQELDFWKEAGNTWAMSARVPTAIKPQELADSGPGKVLSPGRQTAFQCCIIYVKVEYIFIYKLKVANLDH